MDLMQKKQKVEKTGYNINNYINISSVVDKFIQTYFLSINNNNIQTLIDNKIIRNYSSIKFNSDRLQGNDIISFLSYFTNYNISINKYNFIDSGSRRIDISVIGVLKNEKDILNFNQTFIICHQDNSWYIKNSIFQTFVK